MFLYRFPAVAHSGQLRTEANTPIQEVPQEQWEDASPLLQLVATSESGTDGPPSLRKLRPADDDDWPPSNTPTLSPPLYADTAPAVENGPSEQQKLPWETKTRYVIGSGELGLLSELQMPKRGLAVALPPEFLRLPIPTGYAREGRDSPPPGAASNQLIDLNDDDHWEPSVGAIRTQNYRTEFYAGVAANPRGDGTGSVTRVRQAQPVSKGVRGEDIRKVDGLFEARDHPGSIAAADARPNASGSNGRGVMGGTTAASTGTFLGAPITPVRDVETASAAVRIAAFRPGTRFRVALDKGSTGLGITVKEIRGRFFVYRLQALPDGSPGAAEVRACVSWCWLLVWKWIGWCDMVQTHAFVLRVWYEYGSIDMIPIGCCECAFPEGGGLRMCTRCSLLMLVSRWRRCPTYLADACITGGRC